MRGMVWRWALFALGVVGAGAGVWLFVWLGLNEGNQLAGVLSLFVGIASLIVSIAGLMTARRTASTPSTSPATVERPAVSISDSSLARGAMVVRDVAGDVTVRHNAPSSPSASTPPTTAASSPEPEGRMQADVSIARSHIDGPVGDYRGVGGNLEIEG